MTEQEYQAKRERLQHLLCNVGKHAALLAETAQSMGVTAKAARDLARDLGLDGAANLMDLAVIATENLNPVVSNFPGVATSVEVMADALPATTDDVPRFNAQCRTIMETVSARGGARHRIRNASPNGGKC